MEDLIDDIICWAGHVLCSCRTTKRRFPGAGRLYWSLSPARTVTVWLAIDDADDENAAMRFIPGTHKLGPLEWRTSDRPFALHQEIVGADDLGEPVTNTLSAGQISLHADMLAHGSNPNRSNRRRCGLTLRFCPPEVRVVDAVWKRGVEAIICRGSDPTGLWNVTCPTATTCRRRTSRGISAATGGGQVQLRRPSM